jgi:uncharacterized ferritin-like protein (DUF455 family)
MPNLESPVFQPGNPARILLPSETITACAERVLFADTLAEKLRLSPGSPPDDDPPRPALRSLVEPIRPATLRLRPSGSRERAKFPSLAQLGHEDSRGRLFHFFANHELLAAELMALALLRFPDAPAEFRRGLFETLREEQLHTRWYVERMTACGVEFGSHPLSRFFWDAVAPMDSPLDYVTRLSLTFEQANLDYTRHYAAALREIGDDASAKLLERIYHDEIQHVGYGLRWFRQWKAPGQSDWVAYRGALHFPLSPSRAKGNVDFNSAGRIDAGLDSEFVRELALFERSKGRVPRVFWFNPDAEDAIARGPGYQGKQGVVRFVADLECLALFLARRDDIVLLRHAPRREYLERLKREGFDLPEIEIVAGETALAPDSLTRQRKLSELRPWAWEPRSETLLAPLRKNLPANAKPVVWSDATRGLFSKYAQMTRWPEWEGENSGDSPWRSHPCASAEEAAEARAAIDASFGGAVRAVEKAAISAAGRGLAFDETGLDQRSDPVSSPIQPCSIEPWAERVFDFSVQYEMEAAGLRRLAFLRQIVDARGRYHGTIWSPKVCAGLDPDLARYLMETALPRYEPGAAFPVSLEAWLREVDYRGPVGVDAFIFRDPRDGSLRHRIVCEVNPRYTMGRLTWELSRRVVPGRVLRFEIVKKGAADDGSLALTDLETARDWVARLTIG